MGAVAPLTTATRPFITTTTAAPGLPPLRITASANGARLISGGTMGAAPALTATMSFAAPSITTELTTATATTKPAMLATAIAAAGSEDLAPVARYAYLTSKLHCRQGRVFIPLAFIAARSMAASVLHALWAAPSRTIVVTITLV